MWASALGEFLATIGLALYREWAYAASIRGDERGKLAIKAATLANAALTWKAAAAGTPGGGADLRVSNPTDQIQLLYANCPAKSEGRCPMSPR